MPWKWRIINAFFAAPVTGYILFHHWSWPRAVTIVLALGLGLLTMEALNLVVSLAQKRRAAR